MRTCAGALTDAKLSYLYFNCEHGAAAEAHIIPLRMNGSRSFLHTQHCIHREINLLAAPVWEVWMQPHQRHSYVQLAHSTHTVKEAVIHLSSCDTQQCQQEESELKTASAPWKLWPDYLKGLLSKSKITQKKINLILLSYYRCKILSFCDTKGTFQMVALMPKWNNPPFLMPSKRKGLMEGVQVSVFSICHEIP